MFVIIRAKDRKLEYIDSAEDMDEANAKIYDHLLEVYDGDEDKMNEDIEAGEAEYCDSNVFAWTNHNGQVDFAGFWA